MPKPNPGRSGARGGAALGPAPINDAAERAALRALPKAELHLHLEGSLSPETLWSLARRHDQPFGLTSLDACRALYRFRDFSGFIQAIKTASQLLRDPADYAAAVAALARYLRSQGVVYAEVFFSVGILLWRGVAVEPYWEAVETARVAAERDTGVRIRWLLDAVRQFGPEPLERVVDFALRWREAGGAVLGIGVGGDEAQRSAAEFAPAYARARALGLHTTIHAGETRGPESIRDALRHLAPGRIGHGLRAFEDDALVAALAARGVALDVCPTSNLKTGAWPAADARAYPALGYVNRGVRLSVGSDDPGIFATTLLDEFAWLRRHGGFSAEAIHALAAGSFACAFLSDADRAALPPLPFAPAPHPRGD
jgi:aminodeoxyfutalosine deaminase